MEPHIDIEQLGYIIKQETEFLDRIRIETAKVIVGQEHMVERLLIGMLTKGHILLEGLPGLAKTLAIRALSKTVDGKFSRIQFTPDLLPGDVVGTLIYNPGNSSFSVRRGPIFANFVLADEINRAPAKVQSALLEAMQERQVTIGTNTYTLDEPFLVMATQNPIDQEGTYALPEAQTDRFLLKVKIDYPKKEEEKEILHRSLSGTGDDLDIVEKVVSTEAILKARELMKRIYIDQKIENYIVDLVFASRTPADYGLRGLDGLINYGASPRASIALGKAARALAFIKRRAYVIPEDVRNVAPDVLRHRIGLTYEAEAENVSQDDIIAQIMRAVEVP